MKNSFSLEASCHLCGAPTCDHVAETLNELAKPMRDDSRPNDVIWHYMELERAAHAFRNSPNAENGAKIDDILRNLALYEAYEA